MDVSRVRRRACGDVGDDGTLRAEHPRARAVRGQHGDHRERARFFPLGEEFTMSPSRRYDGDDAGFTSAVRLVDDDHVRDDAARAPRCVVPGPTRARVEGDRDGISVRVQDGAGEYRRRNNVELGRCGKSAGVSLLRRPRRRLGVRRRWQRHAGRTVRHHSPRGGGGARRSALSRGRRGKFTRGK